ASPAHMSRRWRRMRQLHLPVHCFAALIFQPVCPSKSSNRRADYDFSRITNCRSAQRFEITARVVPAAADPPATCSLALMLLCLPAKRRELSQETSDVDLRQSL